MDILEYIKQMQEIYGDKVITTADKLEKPPKTVVREMFQNAFTDNKADGGRIGFKKGKKAEGERRMYAGRMMTEDQIEAKKTARLLPKQEGMTWDKKTKSFKPRKDFSGMSPQERKEKFSAPKAAETKKLKATKKLKDFVEKFKLQNNGKLPTQQQIMRAVGGKSETVQKYLTEGVNYAKRATKQEAGKLAGKQFGDLTEEAQIAIKEHFHDVDIDFSKNADGTYKKGKYGIEAGGRGESKALYEQIRRFAGTPEEWKYAYNLGSADGWLLSQMDRAGYEPIYETIKGNKKIIGHIDPDGKKYYGAKKWANKYKGLQVKTSHPDYKATKKLVDITNKTRTLPNKAIRDILTKGGVPVDGKLQLNHLLNYLIDEKGVDVTKSALEKHHVRGVKTSPTKDLQLVTRLANAKANKIRNEIKSGVFDRIDVDDRLKKLGISVEVDGARYGGKGFTSFKGVERFVESNLKGLDKTKLKGLKEALTKICPKGNASGGRIGFADGPATVKCGAKRLEQIILKGGANKKEQELAEKILKAGKGLKNLASLKGLLGPAALAFEVAVYAGLTGYDMLSKGKTFREAVGDSVFNYALGDRTKIDPKEERYKGYAAAGVDKDTIGKISAFENAMDEVKNMQQEFEKEDVAYRDAVISGPRMSGAIKQKQIKNYYDQVKKNQELIKYLEQPQTQEKLKIVDDDLFPAMMSDADAKRRAMQMTKPLTVGFGNTMDFLFPKATYKEDRERAINYMPAVQEYYRGGQFANGGLASLTDTIPPESGPMSEGLRSLYNNGRKL